MISMWQSSADPSDYNQHLDIKGFIWKDSLAGKVPNRFLSWEEKVPRYLWLSFSSSSYSGQSLLPCSLVETVLQQHGKKAGSFCEGLSKDVWMNPGSTRSWLIALHTVFLPCSALFFANGLVLENSSGAMFKRKNTQGSGGQPKDKSGDLVQNVCGESVPGKITWAHQTTLVFISWEKSACRVPEFTFRGGRWMEAHNQHRSAVLASVLPPTSVHKVKWLEKEKGSWLQFSLRCLSTVFTWILLLVICLGLLRRPFFLLYAIPFGMTFGIQHWLLTLALHTQLSHPHLSTMFPGTSSSAGASCEGLHGHRRVMMQKQGLKLKMANEMSFIRKRCTATMMIEIPPSCKIYNR